MELPPIALFQFLPRAGVHGHSALATQGLTAVSQALHHKGLTMSALRKPDPNPVVEAARGALEAADGDVRIATQALEANVRKNRALRDALVEPLLAAACYGAVRAICITDRRKVWSPPAERLVATGVTGAHRVVQLAGGTLLMFPLPGGKKLGDATREEISAAADFYANQSKDMAEKATWLRLVAQSIPASVKAGDVLKEKRLRELQREARNAAS